MTRFLIKYFFLFVFVFLIYFFDRKIFWIFGGISISDVVIIIIAIFSIIAIFLIIIFKEFFYDSKFKSTIFSLDYLIFMFVILTSIMFIKYLYTSCEDLSPEQKCVCLDIKNYQSLVDSDERYDEFVKACSEFRNF